MSDLRDWIEQLGEKIPGYSGYSARERRRDADKAQREHMADRLRAAKEPLNEVVRAFSSTGRLARVGPADRLLKKLDQAENRVRFASYGYTGFFDAVKIDEAQLDALYQFDHALVEQLDEIARLVGEYQDKVADESYLPTALEGAVDKFNRTFDERHRVLDSFRQDDTPGQPMFGA
ncbi:MAG: hypothetical protein LC754_17880 [Acidobacteria bacterium]|nr:hypothetical protein [Acidobacteriota bacterium]